MNPQREQQAARVADYLNWLFTKRCRAVISIMTGCCSACRYLVRVLRNCTIALTRNSRFEVRSSRRGAGSPMAQRTSRPRLALRMSLAIPAKTLNGSSVPAFM